MSLTALEARVAHDLAMLDHGKPDWTRPRSFAGGHVYDVVIVGGGQSGLGAAFGLLRERISNILVIDENPAGYEGPWDTYARMRTLRTPKSLTGIDLGIPSLTFRAWWEAQHGAAGWEALDKIARPDWMAYLRWYRRVLDLPVRNDARLVLVEAMGGGLHRLRLADGDTLIARKIIFATGIQGGGEWHVPRFVRDSLPPSRYAHTSQAVDYDALKGRRVAILGGGASAFDNATAALEAGVAQAHVFIRRPELPRVNPIRFMEGAGFMPRFPALDDVTKYAVMASFLDRNQPPTTDMFERAGGYPGFALHTGSPWTALAEVDGGVRVMTPKGEFDFDFLVLSTGLVTDPALRPELAHVADGIARWGDRVTPDVPRNPVIDAHPYLGPAFEYLPRSADHAAALEGLYAFNYSALISHGLSAAALSGLKYALPRLVTGVANALFADDRAAVLTDYYAFAEEEFTSVWPAAQRAEAAE